MKATASDALRAHGRELRAGPGGSAQLETTSGQPRQSECAPTLNNELLDFGVRRLPR